jgi:saccharopine dehydrogenase-like NADP-dependent oxidoreductase
MMDLGLLSWDPVSVDGVTVAPRAVFAKVAEPVLDRGLPDVILMRLTATGLRAGKPARRVYEMIEYPDAGKG